MTEYQSEPEAQTTTASATASAAHDAHGLPRPLYHRAAHVAPGDAQALYLLLTQHPEMSQQILEVASHHAGLSTVKQAIAMQQVPDSAALPQGGTQKDIRPGGEFALEGDARVPDSTPLPQGGTQKDIRPGGEFALEGNTRLPDSAPLPQGGTQKDIRPGGEFALEGNTRLPDSAPLPQGGTQKDIRPGGAFALEGNEVAAPKAAAVPAWVAGAAHYNEANPTLADEFNDLTSFQCSTDGTKLDPQEVARWQRHHGVAADGKVGPHTVAAARASSAKGATAIAAATPAATDARPPV